MILSAFKHIEGNWTLNRGIFLFSIALVICGFQSQAFANSYENTRDTVLINGHIINITADVEIDTVWKRPEKSDFRKWMYDAEFIALTRVGAEIGGDATIGDGFYIVKNEIRFPEFSLEAAHPFGESFQLYYRGGVSLELSKYFDIEGVDDNAIGFDWEGVDLLEIIALDDPLGDEVDTLKAPIMYSPKFKLALGGEWHGVMRAANGWIWGAQLEWLPKKHQRVHLHSTPDPEEWSTTTSESTYDIISDETNSLQLRAFTSWSPWNFPWFLRAEVCWAPKSTSTWVSLGYRW